MPDKLVALPTGRVREHLPRHIPILGFRGSGVWWFSGLGFRLCRFGSWFSPHRKTRVETTAEIAASSQSPFTGLLCLRDLYGMSFSNPVVTP